jgi:carbon monoxide dehydrogenase subunit G
VELTNDFSVSVPVDDAWAVLTALERIAPCMPGAELQEIDGDEYRGVVKVKVGPIVAQYKGKATFVEQDDANHKAVLRAEGRDVRGQGNASATITATLSPEGDGTKVKVVTDLTITGRAAQFGRGVLADVSTRLLNQFVSCLESKVLAGVGVPAEAGTAAEAAPPAASGASDAGPAAAPAVAPASNGSGTTTTSEAAGAGAAGPAVPADTPRPSVSAPAGGPRTVDYQPAEPVDLLGAAGAPVVKRLAPVVVAGLLLLWLVGRKLRGRG